MNKLDLLKLAYKSLWRRKARTILTVLGVMIGTTAIVVMISLGIGLNDSQMKNMARWGDLNQIRVNQGMAFDREGKPLGPGKQLNDSAVEEIRAIPGVTAVSPAYDAGGEARVGRKRGHLQLIGIDPETMAAMEFKAQAGRILEAGDRNVIVVGSQVINHFRDEMEMRRIQSGKMMFEGPIMMEKKDPLEMLDQRASMTVFSGGSQDKKKIFNFQVVGILEGEEFKEHSHQAYAPIEDIKKMRQFMFPGNEAKSMRTMGREVMIKAAAGGSSAVRVSMSRSVPEFNPNDYNFILVRTKDVSDTKKASQALRDMGYNSWSMADQLEGIEKSSRTVQAILGGIGGITLLVAALGITNTMIMSIYERTKEIGIMKVIGASFRDIHSLFLAEAGLIGLIGGIIGLGLSLIVSYVINRLSQDFMRRGMPMGEEEALSISLIPPWLILFAVAFAILIGLLAGLYPANRAVRLSPVDAIRNE